jgi:hypothetical protein
MMTNQSVEIFNNGRRLCAMAFLIGAGLLCGCVSNTVDASAPGANDNGQYPNINIVPAGETAQLSDGETAATRASLESKAQAQQRGESSDAYLARLRKLQKLGSTHAADVLRQIEQGR